MIAALDARVRRLDLKCVSDLPVPLVCKIPGSVTYTFTKDKRVVSIRAKDIAFFSTVPAVFEIEDQEID